MKKRAVLLTFIALICVIMLGTLISCASGSQGEPGIQGEKGETGVGIQSITTMSDGKLNIVYTDGSSVTLDMPECEHRFGEWAVALAPSCTSIGYNTRTCTLCGWMEYSFIEAVGHTYGNEILLDEDVGVGNIHCLYRCESCGNAKLENKTIYSEGLEYTLINNSTEYAVIGLGTCTDTEIYIPKTYNGIPVRQISGAFENKENVTSVIIPEGVTTIKGAAFRGCKDLKSVSIPSTMTEISEYSFSSCDSLEKVCISDVAAWCAIKFDTSLACPLTYAKNLYLNGNLITELIVPDGVTSVGDYAFISCTALKRVTLPESIQSIGREAFYGCTALQSINLPDGIVNIGGYAFYKCAELTNINIPSGVTVLEGLTFFGCTGLTSVTLPDGITRIGDDVFRGCTKLTSFTIPNKVTFIGYRVFMNCDSMRSLTIGSDVEVIWSDILNGCIRLTDITFNGTKEQWNAIEKQEGWDNETANYTIHCTDGDIAKS